MNIFDYFGNAVCFYDSHFILVQVRTIQALVAAKPMCAILRVTCVMHELQNDFKAGVKAFDDELKGDLTKPSVVTMRAANVWRSFGHHRKLRGVTKHVCPNV